MPVTQNIILQNAGSNWNSELQAKNSIDSDNQDAMGPDDQENLCTQTITFNQSDQTITFNRVWTDDAWSTYQANNPIDSDIDNSLKARGWSWTETIT